MPADEVTHGTSVGESRARSGPRHAAPKKPLLTRLNMPAGKAIALAAMPTAVLMGMGFTPTLAVAEDPATLSLTADEYKDCVEALEAAEEGTDTSASPTPTPSASASESADSSDEPKDEDTSSDDSSDDSASDDTSSDDSSSSDSGSDDKDTDPADDSTSTDTADKTATDATATPSAAASESTGDGNVLEDIGSALEDVFTPDDEETESTTPSESTSPSPSPSASEDASGTDEETDSGTDAGKDAQDTVDVTDKVKDAAKDVTETAEDTEDEDTTADATATPSPSPSESTDLDDCFVAEDDESGVEKGIPALPDDPWYLNASSLLLKGADYKGVVKVKTADGTVKEVLKYVISDGTDIGDLHQTVDDKQAGVTYHVQAGKGTTSTIRDGQTVMYTESISGNLLGLIPVTFDPKHPPPLNIPLIYFTKVTVVQAGQFGGTLTVPGLHQYTTD
ncbi:hypothetical protein ACFU53_23185 [Streptomyces sp. NPDC057474]|uniref:hypothetical protein n=1 Tax=Streptomyces sp. NPDC057474 TaxID=3346144 RepID=UPI0036CCA7A1